jgi:hypothetical protein
VRPKAPGILGGRRRQPYARPEFLEHRACGGIHHHPAAGGDNDALAVDQVGDQRRLPAPEARFALAREDFGDGHAGGLLDFLIGVDEVVAKGLGRHAAEGGFAAGHEAAQE